MLIVIVTATATAVTATAVIATAATVTAVPILALGIPSGTASTVMTAAASQVGFVAHLLMIYVIPEALLHSFLCSIYFCLTDDRQHLVTTTFKDTETCTRDESECIHAG